MSTIDKLPEEVLREILDYALTRPLEPFFTGHRGSCGVGKPNTVALQSEIMLVCKAWQRIGTPLLYASLCLASAEQTQNVARVFKESPRLGRAVRHLRLDGGFGSDLASVVRLTPNVKSLYVNTAVAAEELLGGLRRALLTLEPTTLFIHSPQSRSHNVKQAQVDALLEAMIRQQLTIKVVQFEPMNIYIPWSMLNALMAAPSLRTVSFDACLLSSASVNGRSSLERLTQSSTLESIVCRRLSAVDTDLKSQLSEKLLHLLDFRPDELVL